MKEATLFIAGVALAMALTCMFWLTELPVSNFTFDDQHARNYICSFAVCQPPTPEPR